MKKVTHNIVVAANFTADPIVPALGFWQEFLALNGQVQIAPYDQLFQQLLDAASPLRSNLNGLNLILLEPGAWLGKNKGSSDQLAEQFKDALHAAISATPNTQYIVMLCPSQSAIASTEAAFVQHLEEITGLIVISPDQLQTNYPCREIFDPAASKLADIPYFKAYFVALGTLAIRHYFHARTPARKVIVLDCDDTLWSGLCSELGPTGVAVSTEHLMLQSFAKQQRDAGRLLCLASRNIETDVKAVFEQHPKMLLTLEDITVRKVNWARKSDNLIEIATELGLSLDSFVFIDDDPLQCAEMSETLPEVLTLQLPKQGVELFCDHIWSLDIGQVTDESKQRTRAYREHATREQLRQKTPTLQGFLDSLELNVDITSLRTDQLARAHELAHRTNQFNLSGWRASEAELKSLIEDQQAQAFTIAVTDRFGDYGTVGLMICRASESGLQIPLFVLSCRALGRGVEHSMVRHLARVAADQDRQSLIFEHQYTERNLPARQFLNMLAEEFSVESQATNVSLPISTARACTPLQASTEDHRPSTPDLSISAAPLVASAELAEIPTQLATLEQILSRLSPADTSLGDAATAEAILLAAFKQSLGLEQVDLDDGFFDLGGHSLQAVQVLAEVSNHFEIELDPTLLFTTNFTINELSTEIEHLRSNKGTGVDSVLDQLSALTDG